MSRNSRSPASDVEKFMTCCLFIHLRTCLRHNAYLSLMNAAMQFITFRCNNQIRKHDQFYEDACSALLIYYIAFLFWFIYNDVCVLFHSRVCDSENRKRWRTFGAQPNLTHSSLQYTFCNNHARN